MHIINLDSVDAGTPGVGGKAEGLGVLRKAGLQVPPGFVVTSEAFEKFLADTGIGLMLPGILGNVNPEEPRTAFQAHRQIREIFSRYSGTDFLIRDLKGAYNELSFGKDVSAAGGAALDLIRAGRGDAFVSVRPSFMAVGPCVFPGQGKAFLNLIGYRQILDSVKECWLSAYSPGALLYRKIHGIGSFSLAVVVQKMADSELSGILFTSEPVSGDSGKALVEGCWGLGETLCCGCVSPDRFLIDKESGIAVLRKPGKKAWLRRRGPLSGQTIQERVPGSRVAMETLSDRDFQRFAALARKIEGIFKAPQRVEWAVERGRMVMLQSRPAVLSKPQDAGQAPAQKGEVLLSGHGVSSGVGSGRGLKVSDFSGLQKPREPAVLVIRDLCMEMLPYLKWFSAIVSEQGGAGSCISAAARELGMPVVVGAENATIILEGKDIVVDGAKGEVCLLSQGASTEAKQI